MEIKEGDVVLCTVKKIEKTSIFLNIEGNGEGSMVMSEVAAGRIRNLREYVFPNKKVVCKVLHIENGDTQLSLRRVTAHEKHEVLENAKKEKNLISMLKTITSSPEKKILEIKEEYSIIDFIEEARKNKKIISHYFSAQEAEKIFKLLNEKIEKEKIIKKTFTLIAYSSAGLSDIKQILSISKEESVEIKYLGSSRFEMIAKSFNLKEADRKLDLLLEKIEKKAKEKKAIFEIK